MQTNIASNEKLDHHSLSIDRLEVVRSFKAYFRRSLINSLGSSAIISSRNASKLSQNLSEKEISINIQCSITIFKWIVSDLYKRFCDDLTFSPSLQSIYYSCRSVPSYYILIGHFKKVCDWLELRDIQDRSSLFLRADKRKDLKDDVLRVIGTFGNSDKEDFSTYHIGSDISNLKYAKEIDDHIIIQRKTMTWDELNSNYKDRASILEGTSSVPTDALTTMDLLNLNGIKISWRRNVDISRKHLTTDTSDIEDMGEISLHIPVLFFYGSTAHEINSLLPQKILDTILLSNETSCPPRT